MIQHMIISSAVTMHVSFFFQSDRFQSGIPADFFRSKAQTPSHFSPLSSLSPVQKQRPPANQLLATQAEGELLLAALRQYLSVGLSPDQQEDPLSRLRPFYSSGIENSGLKKETGPLKMGRTQGGSVKDPLSSVDGMCP